MLAKSEICIDFGKTRNQNLFSSVLDEGEVIFVFLSLHKDHVFLNTRKKETLYFGSCFAFILIFFSLLSFYFIEAQEMI